MALPVKISPDYVVKLYIGISVFSIPQYLLFCTFQCNFFIVSGSERGVCDCGRCVCNKGWSGNNCNCKNDTSACMVNKNGVGSHGDDGQATIVTVKTIRLRVWSTKTG